jgi:hypothetical protein
MINLSGTVSKGWLAKTLGVKFDREYYFSPNKRYEIDCQCNEYILRQFPDMQLFYSESNLGRLNYYSKDQVLIGGIQPNMILGMLLGAEFIPNDDKDADISSECLAGKNISNLPSPEKLLNHKLIHIFDEQIENVKSNENSRLCPIPPFFWDISGQAAIHGVLTSAQKFIGESIFIYMMTHPQQCEELTSWIADAYIILCKHFSKWVGGINSVHVGECSSCMISPELFERFVVPATSRIAQALGPIKLHSCGQSTHILRACSNITNLCSLDIGGETSIAKIREIFGSKFHVSIAPIVRDFSSDTPLAILAWAKKVIKENDNGELTIVYHLEPDYNIDNVYALYEFVGKYYA